MTDSVGELKKPLEGHAGNMPFYGYNKTTRYAGVIFIAFCQ